MQPDQLRALRRSLGLTQEALASRLGVSFATVNRWETGKSKPRQSSCRALQGLSSARSSSKQLSLFATDSAFRPVQYLGSKLQLLPGITSEVSALTADGDRVCDLFAGSGVVSHSLAERFRVVAVDIQNYSRVLLSGVLKPGSWTEGHAVEFADEAKESAHYRIVREVFAPLTELEQDALDSAARGRPDALTELLETPPYFVFYHSDFGDARPSLKTRRAYEQVERNLKKLPQRDWPLATFYYGGSYFSYRQSAAIDSLLSCIPGKGRKTSALHNVNLAVVLGVASTIVNTVGKQFAQPMRLLTRDGKPKRLLIDRTVRDRGYDVFEVFRETATRFGNAHWGRGPGHEVFCQDYRQFLREYDGEVSCFYADPPYTIDHYSRFYHVLETLSLRDHPTISTMQRAGSPVVMRGIYRDDRHQSPFSIPSQVRAAFAELFDGIAQFGAPLVLSYAPYNPENDERPRLMRMRELCELASQQFRSVEAKAVRNHAHRKLHSTKRNRQPIDQSESLIVCKH